MPTHAHGPHGHDHDHGHGHAHEPARPPSAAEIALQEADPAQQSLVAALRASFNVLRVIIVLLLVAYFLSGVFRIEPYEQGLIVRLGKLVINTNPASNFAETPVFEQGTVWLSLPEPFDEKIRIATSAQKLRLDTFLFERRAEDLTKPLREVQGEVDTLKPGNDGAMLSGDKNLSHALWEVQYKITDADRFVRNVGETLAKAEPVVKRLVENAVVRAVAHRRIEELLQTAIADVAAEVQRRANVDLARLETGITIDRVLTTADGVLEPGRVRSAFQNVTQAQNARQQAISKAQAEEARILNEAAGPNYPRLLEAIDAYGAAQSVDAAPERLSELRAAVDRELERSEGRVAVALRDAQAQGSAAVSQMQREFEEFTYHREAYRKYPLLTKLRLWGQMRATILASKQNELFFVPSFGEIEILTNRDPARQLEAERERYRRQAEGRP